MPWGMRFRWTAGLVMLLRTVLLWAPPAAAQVAFGDLHATANGRLQTLYTDEFGNLQTGAHSLGFAGNGDITGNYYNPNFLSFSLLPYYGRSQDNSDSQSITDSSGYTGTLNIFSGSHFPGFVNFHQTWNSSGTFGIPDVSGLTTKDNNHGLNIGWSLLLPGLPTLSVGYGETSGTSSLLGSDTSTASTNHNLNVSSSYNLAGFYLNGGFNHLTTDADFNGLESGEIETTNGSSNQFHVTALRGIPYNNSNLSLGFNRSSYSTDDSLGGQSSGTTDNANASLNLRFPRAPATLSANYSANLFGSFEQQLVSSGESPLVSIVSPESHSLSLEASTFYTVLPRLVVGGYVQRTEQYFTGQNYGLTQVGVNANYNFFRKLKGLTVNAGLVDSANQQGNTRVGFVGVVSYNRYFGKWNISTFAQYDQNVQTLLVMYTTSNLNYGMTVKRHFNHDLSWVNVVNDTKSVFEQQSGDGSHAESFASILIWRRGSLSGTYTRASGTSILTTTGLVATPVPASLVSPSNAVVYTGTSYGGAAGFYPVRRMSINVSWSKSLSNTVSPLLLSNNGSTNIYGLANYEYRKLVFTAGFTKFNQSIGSSSAFPSMVTSFSFGVSRWFKGF